MDQQKAMALAVELGSAYPGRSITDQNLLAWVRTLEMMAEDTGEAVVGRLSTQSQDPPSVAALLVTERAVRGEYDFGNQGARPLPDKEMTPEERDRSMAFFVKLREEMYARHPEWRREGIHRNSMFNETPEERIERTRALARLPAPVEDRVDLATLERDSRALGACGGSGKVPVEEPDGTLRCPDCGVIVEALVVKAPGRSQASGLVR